MILEDEGRGLVKICVCSNWSNRNNTDKQGSEYLVYIWHKMALLSVAIVAHK